MGVPDNRDHDAPTHGALGICDVSTISFHYHVVLQNRPDLYLKSGLNDSSNLDGILHYCSMGGLFDNSSCFQQS